MSDRKPPSKHSCCPLVVAMGGIVKKNDSAQPNAIKSQKKEVRHTNRYDCEGGMRYVRRRCVSFYFPINPAPRLLAQGNGDEVCRECFECFASLVIILCFEATCFRHCRVLMPEGSIGETVYTPIGEGRNKQGRVPSVAHRMFRSAVKRFTAFGDFVVLTVSLFVGWSCQLVAICFSITRKQSGHGDRFMTLPRLAGHRNILQMIS